jgi:hypothetical protein
MALQHPAVQNHKVEATNHPVLEIQWQVQQALLWAAAAANS